MARGMIGRKADRVESPPEKLALGREITEVDNLADDHKEIRPVTLGNVNC